MRAGKTLTTLAFIAALAGWELRSCPGSSGPKLTVSGKAISTGTASGTVVPSTLKCLILVPPPLVHEWMTQAHQHCPALHTIAWSSRGTVTAGVSPAASAGDTTTRSGVATTVTVAPYTVLLGSATAVLRHAFDVVVIDEGHAFKAAVSLRHRNLQRLRRQFTLLLSGTPIQNSADEALALVRVVAASLLPSLAPTPSPSKFHTKLAEHTVIAKPAALRGYGTGALSPTPSASLGGVARGSNAATIYSKMPSTGFSAVTAPSPLTDVLLPLLSTIMLRRTKLECLPLLKPKIRLEVWVAPEGLQRLQLQHFAGAECLAGVLQHGSTFGNTVCATASTPQMGSRSGTTSSAGKAATCLLGDAEASATTPALGSDICTAIRACMDAAVAAGSDRANLASHALLQPACEICMPGVGELVEEHGIDGTVPAFLMACRKLACHPLMLRTYFRGQRFDALVTAQAQLCAQEDALSSASSPTSASTSTSPASSVGCDDLAEAHSSPQAGVSSCSFDSLELTTMAGVAVVEEEEGCGSCCSDTSASASESSGYVGGSVSGTDTRVGHSVSHPRSTTSRGSTSRVGTELEKKHAAAARIDGYISTARAQLSVMSVRICIKLQPAVVRVLC